jgi:hypothetical protein
MDDEVRIRFDGEKKGKIGKYYVFAFQKVRPKHHSQQPPFKQRDVTPSTHAPSACAPLFVHTRRHM